MSAIFGAVQDVRYASLGPTAQLPLPSVPVAAPPSARHRSDGSAAPSATAAVRDRGGGGWGRHGEEGEPRGGRLGEAVTLLILVVVAVARVLGAAARAALRPRAPVARLPRARPPWSRAEEGGDA